MKIRFELDDVHIQCHFNGVLEIYVRINVCVCELWNSFSTTMKLSLALALSHAFSLSIFIFSSSVVLKQEWDHHAKHHSTKRTHKKKQLRLYENFAHSPSLLLRCVFATVLNYRSVVLRLNAFFAGVYVVCMGVATLYAYIHFSVELWAEIDVVGTVPSQNGKQGDEDEEWENTWKVGEKKRDRYGTISVCIGKSGKRTQKCENNDKLKSPKWKGDAK